MTLNIKSIINLSNLWTIIQLSAVSIIQLLVKHSLCDCPALSPPVNGALDRNCGTRVGNICRIYCGRNTALIGDRIRRCLPDNTWSGSTTVCVSRATVCPILSPPNNGYQVGNCRTNVGCVCRFGCNSGYTLIGSSQVVCQRTGQWSALPICVPTSTTSTTTTCGTIQPTNPEQNTQVFCPSLGVPLNGGLRGSCNVSPATSVCTFFCNTGYQLIGSNARVCQSNGQWTGQTVSCSRTTIRCSPLTPPRNGALYGYCYPGSVGLECEAVCNSGYTLVGSSKLTCLSNGMWSASVPVCVHN